MEVTAVQKKSLLEAVGELDETERNFCTDETLERYLRARNGSVKKAAKMLRQSLDWRKEIQIESLKAADYMYYIDQGLVYVHGYDDFKRPIVVARKRRSPLPTEEMDTYFKYMMFTLEQAQNLIPEGASQWVLVMDLNGYDRRNSPPLKLSINVITSVSHHFPERLAKCYLVDAPTVFWVLYTAVWPFVDPVTRTKVHFIYTSHYKETGERKDGATDTTGFSKYYRAWADKFDKGEYMKILGDKS